MTEELAVTRENPADLLQMLALAPMYIEVGEKYGVTVSDEQAKTILRNSGVQAETYSDDAILIARSYGIVGGLQSLGEQARVGLAADLAAIDAGLTLTHSPRYEEPGPWVIQDRTAALGAG